MVSTMASAQTYVNVELKDGTIRSYSAESTSKVSFGEKTGTEPLESEQMVTLNGHTVAVSVDEAGGTQNDILAKAYVDGNNVIIKASSFQGKGLLCDVGDDAQCERAITNGKFTFTISEISSDIEAVLGYAPPVTLTVTSDSNGKVWIGNDKNKTNGQFEQGEQVVIHAAPNDNFNLFRWNDNNKESSRTITVGATDVTYSASFISSDLIPGLFTVDSNGKQVFFSKGNLWYGKVGDASEATFNFEANQYDTTPSSNGHRDENHISHFMWCNTPEKAMALQYDDNWNEETPFFAEKNFTVNGYSGWRVLTGGDYGEWNYLLNSRNTAYSDNHRYAGVMVNGMAGLLIFPDDFSSWPSKDAGDEPQTFNTYSENWNGMNYTVEQFTVLQNNGCVFLPAAGCHNDYADDDTSVINVGRCFYWSASPCGTDKAYDLFFCFYLVQPNSCVRRCNAESVRLVTEVE